MSLWLTRAHIPADVYVSKKQEKNVFLCLSALSEADSQNIYIINDKKHASDINTLHPFLLSRDMLRVTKTKTSQNEGGQCFVELHPAGEK